ncbi:DUF4410 domain-containing protein, partial [Candidatus Sumerlaeota bacterium]|nr:DUF4410 domain-containing protein [Candidatus Sumerlaeota bacterium]
KNTSLFYHLYADELLRLNKPKIIHIEPITISAEEVQNERYSLMRQNLTLMEERVYYNLVSQLTPAIIICRPLHSIAEYQALGYSVIKLRVKVTKVHYGSGLLRYLVGYGVGGVVLQVEGSLCDATNGSRIADFVLRVRYSGVPYNGLNFKVISDNYCLRGAIDKAGEDIARFCKALFVPGE